MKGTSLTEALLIILVIALSILFLIEIGKFFNDFFSLLVLYSPEIMVRDIASLVTASASFDGSANFEYKPPIKLTYNLVVKDRVYEAELVKGGSAIRPTVRFGGSKAGVDGVEVELKNVPGFSILKKEGEVKYEIKSSG